MGTRGNSGSAEGEGPRLPGDGPAPANPAPPANPEERTPPTGPTAVASFLHQWRLSGLIDERSLRKLVKRAPTAAREQLPLLVDWLVAGGHLTSFQAHNLVQGNGRSLRLGDFEIRGFLGKGGMGTVYLAFDRRHARDCALKVLPTRGSTRTRDILRFRREMEVSQLLRHPGIAEAFDAGIVSGKHYLAMEYVPGPTLYRFIRQQGPAAPVWAVRWARDVAHALDFAHQAGIVHRDLKPSNVILGDDGSAKLLDLGLARWFDDDHNEERVVGEKRIVGSFDYIAPEQATNSARADARSDIYGLGCLLYFALAGHPPFHDVRDVRQKVECHKFVLPVPIAKLRTEIPFEFSGVVGRMLAKDPTRRFAVAAEVCDVLNDWLRHFQECDPRPWPPPPPEAEPDTQREADTDTEPPGGGSGPGIVFEVGGEPQVTGRAEPVSAAGERSLWQRMGLHRLFGSRDQELHEPTLAEEGPEPRPRANEEGPDSSRGSDR